MKRKSIQIIWVVVVLLTVLGLAFMTGENPISQTTTVHMPEEMLRETIAEPTTRPVEVALEQETVAEAEKTKEQPEERPEAPESSNKENTVTAEPSAMEEPKEMAAATEPSCTLSICCDEVLKNLEALSEEKREIIPSDGWILQEKNVSFTEGETVFDLLLRETKSRGIHFEFVYTPMYQSAYIEGIGNLYEFDCGDTSGWVYKVNGEKPRVGCSQYTLKNSDKVEFIYTCNFLKTQ